MNAWLSHHLNVIMFVWVYEWMPLNSMWMPNCKRLQFVNLNDFFTQQSNLQEMRITDVLWKSNKRIWIYVDYMGICEFLVMKLNVMLLKYDGKANNFFSNVKCMQFIVEYQIKIIICLNIIVINYAYFIVGPYDRIHHVKIMDLDLVWF